MKSTFLLIPLCAIWCYALPALAQPTHLVISPNYNYPYSLTSGETDAFSLSNTLQNWHVLPAHDQQALTESPLSLLTSPFGWSYIVLMYTLAFVCGFLYRGILQRFATGPVRRATGNIGPYDRAMRLAAWFGLLLWAVTTSWNPWLLFFSGFALFEALFSWCGLYAALGRNTCPS